MHGSLDEVQQCGGRMSQPATAVCGRGCHVAAHMTAVMLHNETLFMQASFSHSLSLTSIFCLTRLLTAEQQAQQSQALKMFSALLGQQGSGQAQAAMNSAAAAAAAAADRSAAATAVAGADSSSLEVGVFACT